MIQFLRSIVGVAFGISILLCATFGVSVVMVTPLLLVWPWSTYYYNRILLSYAGWWFTWISTFLEVINGTNLYFSGDEIPMRESALLVANHPSETDWMWFWCISGRKGMAAVTRVLLKRMMMFIPGLGWAMDFANFIFLSRDWSVDQAQIQHSVSMFTSKDGYPFWLYLFPEGTDYAKHKHEKSKAYAVKHGLPQYKHLLLPRIKGFAQCLESCGTHISALYDVTIAYEEKPRPNFLSVFSGVRPKNVHIHVRRWPLSAIPLDTQKRNAWLFNTWQEKDDLLEYFAKHNRFPPPTPPAKAPVWEWPHSRFVLLLNFTAWTLFVAWLLHFTFTTNYIYYQYISWTICVLSWWGPVRRFRQLSPPLQSKQKNQ